MKPLIGRLVLATLALLLVVSHADAQRRGGGRRGGSRGGPGFRGSARASVTRSPGRVSGSVRPSNPVYRTGAGTVNRGYVDRGNVRVGDVNVVRGNWDDRYDGCCYYGPARRAAAVGYAAGAVTAAALGTTVYALPSSCVSTVVNGITYVQCGDAWYRPQFSGSGTTYVVVSPP